LAIGSELIGWLRRRMIGGAIVRGVLGDGLGYFAA
jgi:hypothetical protein